MNNTAEQFKKLVTAVQDLSLARSLDDVMQIVRLAARDLTGADGATFVLRDGNLCYYADENAIAPLWKGKRFPMETCISGWAMVHKHSVAIEDIYQDSRIPQDAYRPTFVKSLAMVPIRTKDPVGAIGNYWANQHLATTQELELLQALADSASIAIEHVQLIETLERKVHDRTEELEAFTYSVSHDLEAPLRSIRGYAQVLKEDHSQDLNEDASLCLGRITKASERMYSLMEGLLTLSRLGRFKLENRDVNLSYMVTQIMEGIRLDNKGREWDVQIQPDVMAYGDSKMLQVLMENLLRNASKFSRDQKPSRVTFACEETTLGKKIYSIQDNGVGFDMEFAQRLFQPFQRFHTEKEFEGNGIGLATVYKIVSRHGGEIWAQSAPGKGAKFFFTIPR